MTAKVVSQVSRSFTDSIEVMLQRLFVAQMSARGPRKRLGICEVIEDVVGALSKALANPDFGSGGVTQMHIANAATKVRLVGRIRLEQP